MPGISWRPTIRPRAESDGLSKQRTRRRPRQRHHCFAVHRILRAIDRFSRAMAGISAVILAAMALLILVEIILWNSLEKTTLIADEYSAYGLAAITFLGAGYCLKEKGHIRITLVLGLLPPRSARIISAVATALTTIFMGYLWWYLLLMVRSSCRYHSTSGTLTNTLLWIPQALMLAGATAFLLQLAATAVKAFLALGSDEETV